MIIMIAVVFVVINIWGLGSRALTFDHFVVPIRDKGGKELSRAWGWVLFVLFFETVVHIWKNILDPDFPSIVLWIGGGLKQFVEIRSCFNFVIAPCFRLMTTQFPTWEASCTVFAVLSLFSTNIETSVAKLYIDNILTKVCHYAIETTNNHNLEMFIAWSSAQRIALTVFASRQCSRIRWPTAWPTLQWGSLDCYNSWLWPWVIPTVTRKIQVLVWDPQHSN